MLEAQGCNLVRGWSPHFFRDPEAAVARIAQAASEKIVREPAMSAAAALDSEVRQEDPGRRVVH